jgi:hypothetical protein
MVIAVIAAITIAVAGIGMAAAINTGTIESPRRKERPRLAHCEAG